MKNGIIIGVVILSFGIIAVVLFTLPKYEMVNGEGYAAVI
jgi:hypothetical protein